MPAPYWPGQDPKEEKKRRDGVGKSGKHMKEVIELGTTIQKVVGMPGAVAPHMTQSFLKPTAAGLVMAPVLIPLAAAYRQKLNAKPLQPTHLYSPPAPFEIPASTRCADFLHGPQFAAQLRRALKR